jgi:hypothetical protein
MIKSWRRSLPGASLIDSRRDWLMVILFAVFGFVCVAALVALYLWVRRVERDVDYEDLLDHSVQSENDRRAKQAGIGLTSGPTTFLH